MKVLILGGDGFCGWPTSLHFAAKGYEVLIVDNLSRRWIMERLSAPSLTPIRSIERRIEAAQDIGKISFKFCDIANDPEQFKNILEAFNADVIVHFAEQRSAPYSMLGGAERSYTVNNNISGTHNLFSILVELKQYPHIERWSYYFDQLAA